MTFQKFVLSCGKDFFVHHWPAGIAKTKSSEGRKNRTNENIQALPKLIILNVLNSHPDTLFLCRFEVQDFLLMNCSQQSLLQMQCMMHGIEPWFKPSASTSEKADQLSIVI